MQAWPRHVRSFGVLLTALAFAACTSEREPESAQPNALAWRTVFECGDAARHNEQFTQAEAFLRDAVEQARLLGEDDLRYRQTLISLASTLASLDRGQEAEPYFLQALEIQPNTAGTERPDLADGLRGLADLYARQGLPDRAKPLYERAIAIREAQLQRTEDLLGAVHPQLRPYLEELRHLYCATGDTISAAKTENRLEKLQEEPEKNKESDE